MAITKEVKVDKIDVLEMGQIQVRTTTRIFEDEVEISKAYSRHVIVPGDSLTGEDTRVQAIATVVWTDEVISAWTAFIAG